MYTPNNADSWKKAVGEALEGSPIIPPDTAIEFKAKYYLPRPQRLKRKKDPDDFFPHIKKPDIDNLLKSTMDAITNYGTWDDDSRVFYVEAGKYYVAKDDEPHAIIRILWRQEGENES